MQMQWKSNETIGYCDDLLHEILSRLPLASLIRFSLVCKQWHNLIKDPILPNILISYKNPGLFISPPHRARHPFSKLEYAPFSSRAITSATPIPPTKLYKGNQSCTILQSCNGLVLCSSYRMLYHVWNPTTKKCVLLPELELDCKYDNSAEVIGMCLAFDSDKSPYYNVIAIVHTLNHQIYSYSSETGLWRVSSEPFYGPGLIGIKGVYWNGVVHWVSEFKGEYPICCFNIASQVLYTMPAKPRRNCLDCYPRKGCFFGESSGHLLYSEIFMSVLLIYEMKRDYSEWFIKHTFYLHGIPMRICDKHCVQVLSVDYGKKHNDDVFLVLRNRGEVMRYNLVSNTCEHLHTVEDGIQISVHQYIVSLSSVECLLSRTNLFL